MREKENKNKLKKQDLIKLNLCKITKTQKQTKFSTVWNALLKITKVLKNKNVQIS